jgi:hypothetical protein
MLSQFLQIEKDKIGYDGFKKIKGFKSVAPFNGFGLPISVFIALANTNDSRFCFPIIYGFKIKLSHGEAITQS